MDRIDQILTHTIAGPFYRRNAGLFLFLFFLLFGIQPSFYDAVRFHYAVIQSILSSRDFFVVVLGIWLVYVIKALLFVRGCLATGAYDYLFLLNTLPSLQRFLYLLRLSARLLAPAGIYALLVWGISVKEGRIAAGFVFMGLTALLCLFATAVVSRFIHRAKDLQQVVHYRLLPFPIPPTLTGFVLPFMLQKQFPALLLIKLVSFSSLYFFVQLETAVFEDRMLWLLFLTLLTGHSFIIYRNFRFMETELSFYRNLPVRSLATLASLLAVYVIILLPEAWALRGLWVYQHHVGDYVWMILTGPLFLLLIHVLLYTENMGMKELLQLLFGVWIVFVLFSLSKHHWLLPAIGLFFSVLLFRLSYRGYETDSTVKDPG